MSESADGGASTSNVIQPSSHSAPGGRTWSTTLTDEPGIWSALATSDKKSASMVASEADTPTWLWKNLARARNDRAARGSGGGASGGDGAAMIDDDARTGHALFIITPRGAQSMANYGNRLVVSAGL